MVWTTGWNGEERGIGYASSPDLINWSTDRVIKLMEDEPSARNFWAPEIFYDAAKGKFLIFWATTIPGRFPKTDSYGDGGFNHRIYYITTTDFETFTPAKLLYEPGFNCIDAAIVKDGDEYVMFVKNETRWPAKKYIVVTKSNSAEGPYGKPSKPITPSWSEGPTAIKINDKWFVYFDMYAQHNYGVVVSNDLKKWDNMSAKLKVPKDIRHGTVFEADGKILSKLLENKK